MTICYQKAAIQWMSLFAILVLLCGMTNVVKAQPAVGNDGKALQVIEKAEIEEKAEEEPAFSEQWSEIWDDEKPTSVKAQDSVNLSFSVVVEKISGVLFYALPVGFGQKMPVVLIVLVIGGVFFTLRYAFINVRMFSHSINVIRGKYDRPEDEGEVTHFQALTSALSATVGLGNIAGVAAAIAIGGPGAIFWMWLCAFLGMSMKFTSCTLAQYYRRVKPDGTVLGGPMVYLEEGIRERFPSLTWLGRLFGIMYACFTIMAAFGGGNLFQGQQTFKILSGQFGIAPSNAWIVGVVMALFVAMVIIGGIKRIGEVTSKLVPAMCLFYCVICLIILGQNASEVPAMLTSIVTSAFSHKAGIGGVIGVVILQGLKRSAFSNEAGLGSAAIAHAAAKTDEPIREGIVAMIGPFIDTIVVCTMTALTILITKSHIDPETGLQFVGEVTHEKGVELTATAFATLGAWAPKLLCIAVIVFAYSTMISWSYYGERSVEYLFGQRGVKPYRLIFVLVVICGPLLSLSAVIDFSDMMLFSMGFPNIIGMILLSGLVAKNAKDYMRRLKSGEIKRMK